MNQNSIESYHKLVEDGQLTKLQGYVLNCFSLFGPMTGRQVSERIPGAWKRCSDLKKKGALIVLRNTICPISGEKAMLYAIPDPFPAQLRPLRKAEPPLEPVPQGIVFKKDYLAGADKALELIQRGYTKGQAMNAIKEALEAM